ncbi:MAG: hypothetical protein KF729_22775 [Sandaracinaceae bacterium]|nr:hypothetical protein [Sandaracinaceae bacterium]
MPALHSGCGRVQPGFEAGEPPTLNGAPYDPFADRFCSIQWVQRITREAEQVYQDWWVYVVEMGEPDPRVELPEHLQVVLNAGARGSALYCQFRWRLDGADPVGSYPASDVVLARFTLESVSHFCSTEYTPGGFRPEVDTHAIYYFRSSDPGMVLSLDEFSVDDGDVRFRGYYGLDGGAPTYHPGPGGRSFFYRTCSPTPSSDGHGPGVCLGPPQCRYFSASGGFERCTWDHVQALPANAALVHPGWADAHPGPYAQVYGGR